MNSAGADFPGTLTRKSVVVLPTIPVGSKGTAAAEGGRCTTSGVPAGCGTPFPSYRVDVSVWLFATQTGAVGKNTMPQGLTRLASTVAVPLAASATRFLAANTVAGLTVSVTDMVLVVAMPP